MNTLTRILLLSSLILCGTGQYPAAAEPSPATSSAAVSAGDPRDDNSLWGISSSAEWFKEYPRFNPLIRDAGARWLRFSPVWSAIEPEPGKWQWGFTDALVANARANSIHISGIFFTLPKWVCADGKNTVSCPPKDINQWKEYVRQLVSRYKADIKYWEVWNEFNSGAFAVSKNKTKDYADLTVAAWQAAKEADPTCKIGIGCANFDVGFIDGAIKAGAADHFDFVCVHPYENIEAVMKQDSEQEFLSMTASLRDMLAANRQKKDLPLWITEIGQTSFSKPTPTTDAAQAEAVVKAFLLSLAQGFARVEWFEARGPSYGKGRDFGLIRQDWTLRPSYEAYKNMTALLGPEPNYLGWLKTGENGFGFVMSGKEGPVLAAWSRADTKNTLTLPAGTKVTDLYGKPVEAGTELALTRVPVFVTGLPQALVKQAQNQAKLPFPWGADYGKLTEVSCRLGATNLDKGVRQIGLEKTLVVNDLTESYRRPTMKGGGLYVCFRVDPTFAKFGDRNLEITVVAKRLEPAKKAGMAIFYESLKGYVKKPLWVIPEDGEWHEHTWTLDDANFVGGWGWNFATDSSGMSTNPYLLKEVRVRKRAPGAAQPPTQK